MSRRNEGKATVSEAAIVPNGAPVIVHEGMYRLYLKPDGNYHLVYKRNDKDTEDHQELPGALLNLARRAGEENMSFPQFMMEAMRAMKQMQ